MSLSYEGYYCAIDVAVSVTLAWSFNESGRTLAPIRMSFWDGVSQKIFHFMCFLSGELLYLEHTRHMGMLSLVLFIL